MTSDFRSLYAKTEYRGRLCAVLTARYLLLGPDGFMMELAIKGFNSAIETYKRYEALVTRCAEIRAAVQATEQMQAEYKSKLSEIPLLMYEGRLRPGVVTPTTTLAEVLSRACRADGRWALDLMRGDGQIGHQIGVIVSGGKVLVFDSDTGFMNFPNIGSLAAFLKAYLSLFPSFAGGSIRLWGIASTAS